METAGGGGKGPPPEGGKGSAPVVRRLRTLKRRKEEKESSKNQVKVVKIAFFLSETENPNISVRPEFHFLRNAHLY